MLDQWYSINWQHAELFVLGHPREFQTEKWYLFIDYTTTPVQRYAKTDVVFEADSQAKRATIVYKANVLQYGP